MAVPDIETLQAAAKDIVRKAKRAGKLRELTKSLVREELEDRYELERGSLKAHKEQIGKAVSEAVGESTTAEPLNIKNASPEPADASTSNSSTRKKKRKSDAALEESRKRTKKTSFPSASVVATSDIEQDEPDAGPPTVSKKTVSTVKEDTPEHELEPVSASSSKENVPQNNKPAAKAQVESDSELSILLDEEPAKPKKRKSSDKAPKKARQKKGSPGLSKDEEAIKRLKSLVIACGIRKVWSKVFANSPRPSEQIKILKDMLRELGMSGRMSLEQARAIKAKRDLEQELEDVKSFEKSMMKQGSRSSRDPNSARRLDEEQDEDMEEVERPKRKTAAQSIMAFLADQSDSD